MTGRDFIDWVQKYFGPYPEGQKKDIADYIRGLSPVYLDTLKKVLLRSYSSEYRKPPDVAVFERFGEETLDAMPELPAIEAPPTEDEVKNKKTIYAEARERGIDTNKEGWMYKLFVAKMKEAKRNSGIVQQNGS